MIFLKVAACLTFRCCRVVLIAVRIYRTHRHIIQHMLYETDLSSSKKCEKLPSRLIYKYYVLLSYICKPTYSWTKL